MKDTGSAKKTRKSPYILMKSCQIGQYTGRSLFGLALSGLALFGLALFGLALFRLALFRLEIFT